MSTQRVLTRIAKVAALALVGVVPIAPANAGVCADGQICQFLLSNSDTWPVFVNIEVVVNNIAFNTQITVNFLSDKLISNNPLGIDEFAYNSVGNIFPGASLPGGFATENCSGASAPPCQMAGFGPFDMAIQDPAGKLHFSFFLDGKETNFAENANGGEFALHIRYDHGCSAYVSDGYPSATTINPECLHGDPEPGILVLLAVALAGLGFSRRKR